MGYFGHYAYRDRQNKLVDSLMAMDERVEWMPLRVHVVAVAVVVAFAVAGVT